MQTNKKSVNNDKKLKKKTINSKKKTNNKIR